MVASAAIWSPAAGLFSDAGATTAYVAGTRVDSAGQGQRHQEFILTPQR
ncbi:MAG: hypothetical protein IPP81_04100 [Chitinophagaceae bacterium]|nr:hypothetical protein [Chitinophagaceae bacterium]